MQLTDHQLSHIQRRVAQGERNPNVLHAEVVVHSWNERLAVWITSKVGGMGCAYAFAALSLISLPAALATHEPIVIVSWIAQTFLQLVLLPIIMVGQNVSARQQEVQAEVDHHINEQLLTLQKQQLVILHRLDPQ